MEKYCDNCQTLYETTTGGTCQCDKDGNSPRDLMILKIEKLEAENKELREENGRLLGAAKSEYKKKHEKVGDNIYLKQRIRELEEEVEEYKLKSEGYEKCESCGVMVSPDETCYDADMIPLCNKCYSELLKDNEE